MRLLTVVLFTAACLAQQKDDWPQFRGNNLLTGVSTSTVPKTLKLLWTYDAGEPVESSAAIADGVVYIGSGAGYLSAVDLATGKLRWKYKVSQDGVGESSAAVRNGAVYIGDLAGVFHAVDARTGKALWTYKTGAEIKSSPVVVDDRVLIGSYDGTLYCLAVKNGAVLWKVTTENYVHGTPAVADGIAYISGCDEVFRGIRISDGKELFEFPSGAYTGASPAVAGSFAYFGTFSNEVVAANLKLKKTTWRYENPDRHFPFYSSAAVIDGKVVLGGRDKLVYCFNAATGKAYVDIHDAIPHRFVSRHRRRPHLHRVQRRPLLCAGPVDRRQALGIRDRLTALRFAGHRGRTRSDRRAGRSRILLRIARKTEPRQSWSSFARGAIPTKDSSLLRV